MSRWQAPPSIEARATHALIRVAAAGGSSAVASTTPIQCLGVPRSRGARAKAVLGAGDGVELEVADLLGAIVVEVFGNVPLPLPPSPLLLMLDWCSTTRTPICRATALSGGTSTAANPCPSMVIAGQEDALSDLMMSQ
eukprot:CAMPEP_0172781452 /NCGR_PEP_ID=MMETSP1074-20121228/203436_1 /TAXON_ID=2916 /ORGANISM="Ceratium fusus, Strain PA161109" /LENGTH=137 /DNA_ID=CAMNT_0013618429 /DNA_START=430 /DNA_END=843 /DNA_ORIENTATION=+